MNPRGCWRCQGRGEFPVCHYFKWDIPDEHGYWGRYAIVQKPCSCEAKSKAKGA